MAKLENPQRIVVEDFPADQQETVERLANTLNYFMENVFNILNNNVDLDNLRQEFVSFRVTTDVNGTPSKTVQFSSKLFTNATNGVTIYARNRTNSTNYPTSMPFISFNPQGGGLYKVLNVTGLVAGEEYEIRMILLP